MTRETADARVWSQRVTTRQDRHNNLCHHHPPPRRDRASHDEDNGQGSRYFAQNPPALASSSRKALHLKALGLLCGALFLGHSCTTLHGRPCGSEKDRVNSFYTGCTNTCLRQLSSRSSLSLFNGCFLSRIRIRVCPPPLMSCRSYISSMRSKYYVFAFFDG